MSMSTRRIVHFTGRVQGVGFRYATCDVAAGYRVTGYVRNLADGRVEMLAEGESEEIDRLVAALSGRMHEYIRDTTTHDSPATGEFTDFRIRSSAKRTSLGCFSHKAWAIVTAESAASVRALPLPDSI